MKRVIKNLGLMHRALLAAEKTADPRWREREIVFSVVALAQQFLPRLAQARTPAQRAAVGDELAARMRAEFPTFSACYEVVADALTPRERLNLLYTLLPFVEQFFAGESTGNSRVPQAGPLVVTRVPVMVSTSHTVEPRAVDEAGEIAGDQS